MAKKTQFSCVVFLGVASAFTGRSPNKAVPAQGCRDIAGEGTLVPAPQQGTGSRVVVLLLGWAPCRTAGDPASLCFPPLSKILLGMPKFSQCLFALQLLVAVVGRRFVPRQPTHISLPLWPRGAGGCGGRGRAAGSIVDEKRRTSAAWAALGANICPKTPAGPAWSAPGPCRTRCSAGCPSTRTEVDKYCLWHPFRSCF